MIKKRLPLIKLKINPENGSYVQQVSIVNDPAVMSSFISFSNNIQSNFSADSERMELIGIAMRCNTPIYRNSPETGEYACEFDADTVRQIAQEYAKNGFFKNNMNLNHSDQLSGSYIFQSYIVSTAQNIPSPKGLDAKDGDWIIGVKVVDPAVWEEIKIGNSLSGFSIEGTFDFIDTDSTVSMYMQSQLSELETALKELEELQSLKDNISAA